VKSMRLWLALALALACFLLACSASHDAQIFQEPQLGVPESRGDNPWMPGTVPQSMPAPPGTYINMALAPGQLHPGDWGTFDAIPNVHFVRNDLAVTPAFKAQVASVQRYRVPAGVEIETGIVGPQEFDGIVYPGGANQVRILHFKDTGLLVPVGPAIPIH